MEKVQNLRFIAYTRISTDKQSEDSLDAQQFLIEEYIKSKNGVLLEVYQDTETGGNDSRPILLEAISRCQKLHATLIVSKLDRLARRLPFLITLEEKYHINFVALNIPMVHSKHMLYILALFAELEKDSISERTKEALAAKRAAGTYHPTGKNLEGVKRNPKKGSHAWQEKSKEHRIMIFTEIERLYLQFMKEKDREPTVSEMATLLNQNYNRTLRNKEWTEKALQHLLKQGQEKNELADFKFFTSTIYTPLPPSTPSTPSTLDPSTHPQLNIKIVKPKILKTQAQLEKSVISDEPIFPDDDF